MIGFPAIVPNVLRWRANFMAEL